MPNTLSLDTVQKALQRRGFTVRQYATGEEARAAFLQSLAPGASVAVGGSMTVKNLGVADALREGGHEVLWHWEVPGPEQRALQLRALTADHYLCSANALTADGRLAFLDGVGNRLGSLCMGPRQVSLFIGRNKLCASGVPAAMARVKAFASPPNAARVSADTPCRAAGKCNEAACEHSICRGWLFLDYPFFGQEIHVYLIDQDLGY